MVVNNLSIKPSRFVTAPMSSPYNELRARSGEECLWDPQIVFLSISLVSLMPLSKSVAMVAGWATADWTVSFSISSGVQMHGKD